MWHALQYYALYPILILISYLPFAVLWKLSDVLYIFVYHIFRYRIDVTTTNLQKAFPEKPWHEILSIRKKFYRFLCDQVLISIKTHSAANEKILSRCRFVNTEIVEQYKQRGKKILFVLGHYGMWEISGSAFSMHFNIDLTIAYKPLANKYFNRFVVKSRSRFGNLLIAKKELIRYLNAHQNTTTYLALIADQSPNPKEHYWVQFLGRQTAVVTGMEKLARLYDFVVIYAGLQDAGRGRNCIRFTLLSDNPCALPVKKLTEMYMQELEKDIRKNPIPYLWSHKRWKLTDRLQKSGQSKSL